MAVDRPNSPSSQPTRRALLTTAALAAPALALPAVAAEADPHPGWYREWQAALAALNRPDVADDDPAQLRLALAFVAEYGGLGDGVNDEALLSNALVALEPLAGEGRA